MELGTHSSRGSANSISLDGVSYDISNLLLKSNVGATEQKIYPTHLLSQDDDDIYLNESHYDRNRAGKQAGLYSSESLGLDNVFITSKAKPKDLWPNQSMHNYPASSPVKDQRVLRRSYNVGDPRQQGELRALLSYRPDDEDDDSVCCGDPVRSRLPSPVAVSPKRRVSKVSTNQRDGWGQGGPLKTPYEEIERIAAKSMGPRGASNEKLNELLHLNYNDNNDSDTSMGVESLMIEIMPGLSEPLRGSAETIKAHMSGNIMRIHCVCCDQDISCVGDAAYVLCPNCTVVSPAPSESMNGSSWGVGLGFLADQFQADDSMLSRSSSHADSPYSRNY